MYRIKKDDEFIQYDIDHVVIDPVLKTKVNSAGTLTYSLPIDDITLSDYVGLKTKIAVYDPYRADPIWRGRLLYKTKQWTTIQMEFEGELAMLNDVQYPPFEFNGDPPDLLRDVLDHYNSKCTKGNEIYIGLVTVTDPNNYINRSSSEYLSCWKVITDKLVKLCGGYIKLRYAGDKRYLDYLIRPGKKSLQNVEFGVNLLDLEEYIDASTIATRLIPLGAEDEATGQRVTIESVNDGSNYIESELINTYGIIERVEYWDDVTVPENLKRKAEAKLSEIVFENITVKCNVLDLHWTDESIQAFECGDTIEATSNPHKVSGELMLNEYEQHLNAPWDDSVTIGQELKKITSSVLSNQSKAEEADSKLTGNFVSSIIALQTALITGGLGGNFKFLYNEEGRPSGFMMMDTDSVVTAKEILMATYKGIGFGRDGINGDFPIAITYDGTINANFIRTGIIAGECFELDLDRGALKFGKRDENHQLNNSAIEFNIEDLAIHAKNGISIDDGVNLFKNIQDARHMALTYNGDVLFYVDQEGVNAENIKARYIVVSGTCRQEAFSFNEFEENEIFTGHFSLGGVDI